MADHRFPFNSPALLPQNAPAVWNFDGIISYHDLRKGAPVPPIVAGISRHALRHMVAVPEG
jgi:hypothetical protein